jgi:hypothetical protein
VDVALIHFDVLEPTNYCYFVDIMNEIDQGTSLARIGFPFVEFNNYIFDNSRKTLNFTTNNEPMTTFVNDAVVSQNYGDYNNGVFSRTHLILSSPGIKGQSGGPVYDNQGRVAGIQSATATRELDFIGKTKVKNKLVETPQFLNIGICVSAEVIKEFLIQHNVKYYVK